MGCLLTRNRCRMAIAGLLVLAGFTWPVPASAQLSQATFQPPYYGYSSEAAMAVAYDAEGNVVWSASAEHLVSRSPGSGTNAPEKTLWLQYSLTAGNVQFWGQGYVPLEAFRVFGESQSALLHIDTSAALPDFQAARCDLVDGNTVGCVAGGGPIVIQWSGDGVFGAVDRCTTKWIPRGTGEPMRSHDMTLWRVSATATGTMLGFSVTGQGQITSTTDRTPLISTSK